MSIFNGTTTIQINENPGYEEHGSAVHVHTVKTGFSQCGNNNND